MTVQIIHIKSQNNKSSNPFNPLSRETRLHLSKALQLAIQTPDITSIILYGGSNFSAGADITEFQPKQNQSAKDAIASSEDVPSLTDLAQLIESSPKPIVAALTGVALGGGCELALACHFRVALKNCNLGLPEVKIGLIPGAGGTQRLPRLTNDVAWCLDVITSGRMVGMEEARRKGVVDDVIHSTDILDVAKKWATFGETMGKDLAFRKCSNMRVFAEDDSLGFTRAQKICDSFQRKIPPKDRGGESLHAAVAAVRASFEQPDFEQSMGIESDLFWDLLLHSKQGRGLRHAFFAERAVAKGSSTYLNGSIAQALNQPQNNDVYIGVVGAGTMGSGIAINFLRAGYKVILVDNNAKGLERGASTISQVLQQDVKKKRMSADRAKSILTQNFSTTTDMSQGQFCKCIVVVEAVFENLEIKQAIFRQLDQVILNPQALLLSNTSTLNIDSIASALSPKRRAYCAGMHFFSPAHVMKLVEIVISSDTSAETIALVQFITSKKLKKVGVTVGNCEGFVGNRMLFPYTGEATFVLEEGGATVSEVDNALTSFGMAIGPMNMGDLAGNDIGYLVRKGKGLTKDPKTGAPGPNRGKGMRYSDLPDDLVVKLGRVGQKAMKGWYDYDMKVGKGRHPIQSKEVETFIASYGHQKTNQKYSKTEIIERTLFPLVNEGFKILEENIAAKPSDIDVIYLYGYGWPAFRGGPMYWIDNEVGLGYFLKRLQEMNDKYPGSTYYIPSKLLKKCVALGLTLQQYYEEGMQHTHKQKSKL
jgi:3-hydroxyacyl-CoA dehydrogenase/enoyl-CoA hydratase/carnithine racemase